MSGWPISYIKGPHGVLARLYCSPFPEDRFVLANSGDPDEMPHYAAFH